MGPHQTGRAGDVSGPLGRGIPSHDRFNAVFALLRPAEFEKRLLGWITALHEITGGRIVVIDGQALRRSLDKAGGKSAIHMVSAWAMANRISLGQVPTDAIGCQTESAAKIVERKADDRLAVKGNRPTLHQGLMEFVEEHPADDFARTKVRRWETIERGHGRDERRTSFPCPVPDDMPDRRRWARLMAIGAAITMTVRNGKRC